MARFHGLDDGHSGRDAFMAAGESAEQETIEVRKVLLSGHDTDCCCTVGGQVAPV